MEDLLIKYLKMRTELEKERDKHEAFADKWTVADAKLSMVKHFLFDIDVACIEGGNYEQLKR